LGLCSRTLMIIKTPLSIQMLERMVLSMK
jgi:hypothetical protein